MEDTVPPAIRSGLYIVERNLNMIRQLFDGAKERCVIHSTSSDIAQDVKAKMLPRIDAMFTEIGAVKAAFNLEAIRDSTTYRTHALISQNWVVLEDTRPEKLKGYGDMTDEEAQVLSRHVTALLALNDALLEELRQNTIQPNGTADEEIDS